MVAAEAGRVAGGSETILLVEDLTEVRNLVESMLERHGHVVIAAESGAEAFELARKHDGRTHLLLTDVS